MVAKNTVTSPTAPAHAATRTTLVARSLNALISPPHAAALAPLCEVSVERPDAPRPIARERLTFASSGPDLAQTARGRLNPS